MLVGRVVMVAWPMARPGNQFMGRRIRERDASSGVADEIRRSENAGPAAGARSISDLESRLKRRPWGNVKVACPDNCNAVQKRKKSHSVEMHFDVLCGIRDFAE
jgi:hypothetical protein